MPQIDLSPLPFGQVIQQLIKLSPDEIALGAEPAATFNCQLSFLAIHEDESCVLFWEHLLGVQETNAASRDLLNHDTVACVRSSQRGKGALVL